MQVWGLDKNPQKNKLELQLSEIFRNTFFYRAPPGGWFCSSCRENPMPLQKKGSFPLRISSANVTIKCKCNHFICKQNLGQSLFWCSICLNIPEAIAKLYFSKLLLYPVSYRCASYQYDKFVTINYLKKV